MNKNTLIISVVIALVVGLGFGYVIGWGSTASSYQAQIAKAAAFFPQMTDVRSVSGTVKSVSGNSITVTTVAMNPFDTSPTERIVTVGNDTAIVKDVQKDPKVFQDELAAYQTALGKVKKVALPAVTGTSTAASAAASIPTPPSPFTEETLKLSDLKAGTQVTVTASENIKTATTFEATRISVNITVSPIGTVPPVVTAPAPKP